MEIQKVYRCFISSPNDCVEEREKCKTVIEKVNGGLANHLGVKFKAFMWESDVLPDIGKNPQQIIDDKIKNLKYDIFVGIMKNRFGTPTLCAESGTEHEFQDALERKKNTPTDEPRILFFFGNEHVDLNHPKIEEMMVQHKKVKDFKNRIGEQGLYQNFDSIEHFEEKFEEKLNLFITELSPFENASSKIKEVDIILKKHEDDLNDSLKAYNKKSPVWIEPILSNKQEIPDNPSKNQENQVEIKDIIDAGENIIIRAPSEFGLTTLGHYIKLTAWKKGKSFVYIDAKKTKKHKIVRRIQEEIQNIFLNKTDQIDCIILDSVCFEENGIMQMIKNICDEFKTVPLILLNTLDNSFFLKSDDDDKVEIRREFKSYYLMPLSQNEVRKVVTSYSKDNVMIADYDSILNKVTKDLETLNIHRTVKNCISILKASSKMGDDYSPINRTKLLETILFGIFQDYELPTYHDEKPDIKDCSFVLGYLCELLVVKKDFEFSDRFFKEELTKFCEDNFITVDLNYLLQVLKDNSIISTNNIHNNYFKNAYWVFFFIAQRMNLNEGFRDFIYKEKKYIDYPEIIEFYTGIDRNKEDALILLNQDLIETLTSVREKVNIPNDLNPYKAIQWTPDLTTLQKEEAKIGENVITSGFPDEVKDKYEDKNYNQTRPYNQVINSVMRDYLFLVLMRQISASSRALRNSDFVTNSKLKKELINNIALAWNEVNKLLIVLAPLLADKGYIAFEGAQFNLNEEDFQIDDPGQKRMAVLIAIPTNIVKFFKDDLYSSKIAPLIIDKAINESNSLIKHELMILLITERPKKWREIIDNYIVSLNKNSFFLSDILSVLNFNIEYKSTESNELNALKMLAKKCRAKHLLNADNPDMGTLNRLDKLEKGSRY